MGLPEISTPPIMMKTRRAGWILITTAIVTVAIADVGRCQETCMAKLGVERPTLSYSLGIRCGLKRFKNDSVVRTIPKLIRASLSCLKFDPDLPAGHRVCATPHCRSSPCMNDGGCEETMEAYHCTCRKGYTGTNCETLLATPITNVISPCVSDPCLNGGTCQDEPMGFKCTCALGFEGIQCDNESAILFISSADNHTIYFRYVTSDKWLPSPNDTFQNISTEQKPGVVAFERHTLTIYYLAGDILRMVDQSGSDKEVPAATNISISTFALDERQHDIYVVKNADNGLYKLMDMSTCLACCNIDCTSKSIFAFNGTIYWTSRHGDEKKISMKVGSTSGEMITNKTVGRRAVIYVDSAASQLYWLNPHERKLNHYDLQGANQSKTLLECADDCFSGSTIQNLIKYGNSLYWTVKDDSDIHILSLEDFTYNQSSPGVSGNNLHIYISEPN